MSAINELMTTNNMESTSSTLTNVLVKEPGLLVSVVYACSICVGYFATSIRIRGHESITLQPTRIPGY